jgi:hypothetical protein
MNEDPESTPFPDDDEEEKDLLEEEESAAAAEAGRIGGRSGMENVDEAERGVREAGGGEREGFEEAEKLLEENASHGGPGGDPYRDAPDPEAEEDPGVYGDADELESTEKEES